MVPGNLTTGDVPPPRNPVANWRTTQAPHEAAVALVSTHGFEACTGTLIKVHGTHALLCARSVVPSPVVAQRATADFFADGSGTPVVARLKLRPWRLFEVLTMCDLVLVAVDDAPLRAAKIAPLRPQGTSLLRAALREAGLATDEGGADSRADCVDGGFDDIIRALNDDELTALDLVAHDCAATKERERLKLSRVFTADGAARENGKASRAVQSPPAAAMRLGSLTQGPAKSAKSALAAISKAPPAKGGGGLSLTIALRAKKASRKIQGQKENRLRTAQEADVERNLNGLELLEIQEAPCGSGSHGAPIFWHGHWVAIILQVRPGVRIRFAVAADPLMKMVASSVTRSKRTTPDIAGITTKGEPADPVTLGEPHPFEAAPFVTFNHIKHVCASGVMRPPDDMPEQHRSRATKSTDAGGSAAERSADDALPGVRLPRVALTGRSDAAHPSAEHDRSDLGLDPVTSQLLVKAVHEGNLEMLQQLQARHGNATVRTFVTADGRSLAHIAAFSDSEESLLALRDLGVDLRASTRFGDTPAHIAAYMGHVDVLRLLLQNGADVDAPNGRGERPVDKAALQRCRAALEWFAQAGIEPSPPPPWNAPPDADPF